MTETRDAALTQIKNLIEIHHLNEFDILNLYKKSSIQDSKPANLLQLAMMCLGGIFIFAGLGVYINMIWDDINSLSRVIITLGSGLVAFILSLLCTSDARFTKALTPFIIIAGILQPVGLFVFMDEYLPHTGNVTLAACYVMGFMLVQQFIAFMATRVTGFLFFSVFFFYSFICMILNLWEIRDLIVPVVIGISGLMVAWGIDQTSHRSITPFYYFCMSGIVAIASFDLLQETKFDILLVGVSLILVYVAIVAASRIILTVFVLSLWGYLVYFTNEYFKNIVSWPIALIILGLVMIGVSAYAVKIGKNISSHA